MMIRTQTTLSGFGLMLLADLARMFGLREDTGRLPEGASAPPYEFRSRAEFDRALTESRERMARHALPVGAA